MYEKLAIDLLGAGFLAQLATWGYMASRAARTVRAREARDRRETPSRGAFERQAEAERVRAQQVGRDLTLAVFEIDGLAGHNQRLGYATGDLLIAVARRTLLDGLRRIDTLHTLGGGAWAVAIPDRDGDDAQLWLENLRRTVQQAMATTLHDSGGSTAIGDIDDHAVSMSLGSATSHRGVIGLDDLWQAADQACMAAKVQGGGRGCVWNDASRDIVRRAGDRRRRSRDSELGVVLSLAAALDMRDADTSSHSRQVGRYAELMAQALGMAPAHVERVRIAGLLHDIGKIGVPDSVLRKPSKLDDDEWAMMKTHPEIGARLLASIDAEDIRGWVLAHHERPDGRGYPLGLTDGEIPIEAKILSVADAYEAMTADRVYRAAPGPRIAREELDKWRGQQFDSEVVDAFIAVLDELEPIERPAETIDEPASNIIPLASVRPARAEAA